MNQGKIIVKNILGRGQKNQALFGLKPVPLVTKRRFNTKLHG